MTLNILAGEAPDGTGEAPEGTGETREATSETGPAVTVRDSTPGSKSSA
jgi:hypothetical protein